MAFFLAPFGNTGVFDANGNPLNGGSWRTFLAGTTTPRTTYTSQAGTTAQGTTMTLDALGLPTNGPVWMEGGIALKFRLFDAAGVIVDEWDNVSGIGDIVTAVTQYQPTGLAPIYISATSFSLAGDQTNEFQVLRKIETVNTGGTAYSKIASAVFAAGITTVVVTNQSGVLDAGLSTVALSFLTATNPAIPEGDFGATLRVTATQAAARTALGITDPPPVRQTVLSGPVDTNGQSAFGGSTGSTTVTATGTLVMTAANGNTNRTGTKVNPSWTGLSTNGTMYMYVNVNADGTLTEGVGTQAPIYQWGGTPATTSGLFTFNIQQMTGYIGNGSTAPAGYRVYVGEVTVAGAVVTAIVWYALMGRYVSADTAIPGLSVRTAFSARIGTTLVDAAQYIRCVTAEFNFTAGMVIQPQMFGNSGFGGGPQVAIEDRVTLSTVTGPFAAGFGLFNRTTGGWQQVTAANWLQFVVAKRSW